MKKNDIINIEELFNDNFNQQMYDLAKRHAKNGISMTFLIKYGHEIQNIMYHHTKEILNIQLKDKFIKQKSQKKKLETITDELDRAVGRMNISDPSPFMNTDGTCHHWEDGLYHSYENGECPNGEHGTFSIQDHQDYTDEHGISYTWDVSLGSYITNLR